MRVLVTGSNGFIGKNLVLRLRELPDIEVLRFDRNDAISSLADRVAMADVIVHLAGENRPIDESAFQEVNVLLTQALCDAISLAKRKIPVIFASSIQAEYTNVYGQSKRAAELVIEQFATLTGNPAVIYRLPNVFGKWCKPNYNSVVATFCHNVAHGLSIHIHDPAVRLRLLYVDDVVSEFLNVINGSPQGILRGEVVVEYSITLGELAVQIEAFKQLRTTLLSDSVGTGFVRALYATYVSYLPPSKFAYDLPFYSDNRGVFVEMLKTRECGQFSYFTAHHGVTRGSHYHHSKTEKFLVIRGSARFCFRHVLTNELYTLFTSGELPQVVDTVPGWAHDVTNVGEEEMVVMLWSNEIFDRQHPDTIAMNVIV